MVPKPLSYESLKCVLQYMEANQRFQISQHCPSIRGTEKVVPLRINKLIFGHENAVHVNNTRYRIGICRRYNDGQTPRTIQEENDRGGVHHEVDKYGIEDRMDRVTLMDGDTDIHDLHLHRFHPFAARVPTPVEEMAEVEETIRRCEEKISKGVDIELNTDVLERYRVKRIPFQYWKDNTKPPYEHFLRITVACDNQKRIEHYHHNKKYREAWKQLTTFMFAGRRCTIHLNEFHLYAPYDILRLPIGVKFHIQGIRFSGEVAVTFDKLSPVIDSTSYPLGILNLHLLRLDEITHPIVKQAKLLVVTCPFGRDRDLAVLLSLSNQNSRVRFTESVLPAESMIALIQHWEDTKRPIGTFYEFVYFKQEDMKRVFAKIGNEIPEIITREETMTLPMSDTAQLEFSYTKGTHVDHRIPVWTLEMRITPLINNV